MAVRKISCVASVQARSVFWRAFFEVGLVLLRGWWRFDYLGNVFQESWSRFCYGHSGGLRLWLSRGWLNKAQNFGFHGMPWQVLPSIIALKSGLSRCFCGVRSRCHFGLATKPGIPDSIMLRVQPRPILILFFVLFYYAQLYWRFFVYFVTLVPLRGVGCVLGWRFLAYHIRFCVFAKTLFSFILLLK